MTGKRIGGGSNIGPELQGFTPKRRRGAPRRASTGERASATALAELLQERNERRARAASKAVTGARDGFKYASPDFHEITGEDPDDWRAHACRALIAWHNGTGDREALRALDKVNPEQATILRNMHEIVEQTLKADPFAEPSVSEKANPVIVVPGKQLTSSAEMDGDLLDRMKAALKLAKRYPNARIILSGGATVTRTTECSVMKAWLLEQGISGERLLLDPLATVTTGNAVQTSRLLRECPGADQVLLVTDEDHIRRAFAIFVAIFMQCGLEATVTAVPAGGSKAGNLAKPADDTLRAKVYLDLMHACGLFTFRGQPRFYKRGNAIGDALPGDPKAGVELALPKRRSAGAASDTPEYVTVKRLNRGELSRGAEALLLERLLRGYGMLPKAFRLARGASENQQRAVLEAIEALGLKCSGTEKKDGYIQLRTEPAPAASTTEPATVATGDASSPRQLPREPVMDARQVQPAAAIAPHSRIVVAEPRFHVSRDGRVYLNGSVHAVDLDAIREQPDDSCDEFHVLFGPENWNERALMQLGREGARLLRPNGRLLVFTGAEPHAPIARFIQALTTHGFSVSRVSTAAESAFYPAMSDPSAGGVTLECVKKPPQPNDDLELSP